eukprot:CAMPEP_0178468194 /NCGR_PEP_ID=MMETSP0689_2-20121128/52795_1 /TAXON_ID=160604 /ORGANISM="Amphidinium massartii, Strain CS-259" /LENGTH=180 /DNA_ID=CAMNT_0020095245 /DNA_START=1302 /DNA_END=1842 /DNA_ORIENTATION=-
MRQRRLSPGESSRGSTQVFQSALLAMHQSRCKSWGTNCIASGLPLTAAITTHGSLRRASLAYAKAQPSFEMAAIMMHRSLRSSSDAKASISGSVQTVSMMIADVTTPMVELHSVEMATISQDEDQPQLHGNGASLSSADAASCRRSTSPSPAMAPHHVLQSSSSSQQKPQLPACVCSSHG